MLTHLRHVVDPDGADADAAQAFDRRGLGASPTLHGMVRLDALLDPGEALRAAVNSGPPPTADDTRTPAQRRADRLGEILRADLGSADPPTPGNADPARPRPSCTGSGPSRSTSAGVTAPPPPPNAPP